MLPESLAQSRTPSVLPSNILGYPHCEHKRLSWQTCSREGFKMGVGGTCIYRLAERKDVSEAENESRQKWEREVMEREDGPEGFRTEVRGLVLKGRWQGGRSQEGGPARRVSEGKEVICVTEDSSYAELKSLWIWRDGASLSEKREHVLMPCGLQNRQQCDMELTRGHRYIKNKPAYICSSVCSICQGHV